MPEIAALILAAGTASRFRAASGEQGPTTKLVALLDGKALVRHVAEAALASPVRPLVVVTGHARSAVEAALADLPVRFVHNPDFATGMASSLRAGLAALPGSADGALVLLGDMPRITPGVIEKLVAALAASPGAKAVVPVLGGRSGNPALITRALFSEVAGLKGDAGARALLASAGKDVIEVPVEDSSIVFDVDTPDVLAAPRN